MEPPRTTAGSDLTEISRADRKITLLIPTQNRSDLLMRLLSYYNSTNFQGYICIGDSSQDGHLRETREMIQKFCGNLNIVYREYPALNISECMTELARLVSTDYVAALMDDDFLVPHSLGRCVHFLEAHPEYVAAHGIGVLFTLESDSAYGSPVDISYYRQPALKAKSAAQRLTDHLGKCSVPLFSVHRAGSWLAMWRDASIVADRWISEELLPGCLSVIQGKIKALDCLYLVRQVHNRRTLHKDIFDQLTSPNWFRSYELFRDCLVGELVRQDGITLEKAREVVKQAFWSYLANGLTNRWPGRYGQNGTVIGSGLRRVARSIRGARQLWREIRALRHNDCSLSSLLRPSSRYHADFMPIYRAVVSSPKELTT